jgi:SulP family sulfate permease
MRAANHLPLQQVPVMKPTLAAFAERFSISDRNSARLRQFTPGRVKTEVLSGLTVALALVPEAVAFAFVAGVNPLVGLYAAFLVGITTAVLGGQPGMISGATGALAVVMVELVSSHGVEYLFATVVLMGLMQILAGVFRLGKLIRLVPHPVMLGFVNGLAIVIFLAQMSQFQVGPEGAKVWMNGVPLAMMAALVVLTMGVIWIMPKITKAIPAPLAGIGLVAAVVIGFGLDVPRVGDLASIEGGFPAFHLPMVPINVESLKIIFPYALILAAIGLIESLLTLNLVGEMTGKHSGGSSRECVAQGVANTLTGFFGGMGGCAMIGQTVINLKSGGRTRLSGIVAALFLLAFILVGYGIIEQIPLAALVGVMFMVVIGTFAWQSLRIMQRIPLTDAFVIILVTGVTVYYDLATAVIVGVIVSALSYAWSTAKHIHAHIDESKEGTKVYQIEGPLFFGSTDGFAEIFTPEADPDLVVVDFLNSRVVDQSALQAIERMAKKYRKAGKNLQLRHLSHDCHQLLKRAGQLMVDSDDDPDYGLAVDYSVRPGFLGTK